MTSTTASSDQDLRHTDLPGATASPPQERLRAALTALGAPQGAVLDLLVVDHHRSAAPEIYDVPVSAALAGQLLEQVAETAAAAATAELRRLEAGFSPGPQQWVYGPVPPGPLADLEHGVLRRTHRQYDRTAAFGTRSLLVLRVRAGNGAELARVYQGFSSEKALARGKRIVAFWNGERFTSLDDQPLVIDRGLRLFTFGEPDVPSDGTGSSNGTGSSDGTGSPTGSSDGTGSSNGTGSSDGMMVMKSNNAYESLFGALPELREQAAATFTATLGKLPIVGGEELRSACASDLNMMRKLLSIQHRMEQPGYPDAVDMPGVIAFLERNPHVNVPVETFRGAPALVFHPQAQQRWALLKLLDDDFLRSDLTNINYEANSKTEVTG